MALLVVMRGVVEVGFSFTTGIRFFYGIYGNMSSLGCAIGSAPADLNWSAYKASGSNVSMTDTGSLRRRNHSSRSASIDA